MRRIAPYLVGLLACGAGMPRPAAVAAEPKSWEFGGRGKWAEVQSPASQPVSNLTLDKAEQHLSAGDASAAEKLVVAWVKTPGNQAAPDRDRALFLLADAYYRGDERVKAFYQLDELLDTYPESRFFAPALERQYAIADEYLNGYKDKLLGMRVVGQDDKAIDMLFRVRERAPGSPLAERALLRTADYYFATSQFDFAGDAYQAYARAYPRSPEMGKVKLRQALSSLAQFRGTKFDSTPLIDARAQFEDLKVRYPDVAQQADVQKFIDTINRTLARKLLGTADFYRRTNKPKAAAYSLLTLVATYPTTAEADQARAELQRLPKAVVEQAGQVRRSEPTTQPVGPLGPPDPTRPVEVRPGVLPLRP